MTTYRYKIYLIKVKNSGLFISTIATRRFSPSSIFIYTFIAFIATFIVSAEALRPQWHLVVWPTLCKRLVDVTLLVSQEINITDFIISSQILIGMSILVLHLIA